jgi:saccharopine dehydrogenase-like NADP-dependent oxidoreductase
MEAEMQITVLGTGLVGSAIVQDLAREPDYRITAVDRDERALRKLPGHPQVETLQADLVQEGSIARAVRDADMVICAVPGFMGFATLRQVIQAGVNVVDISFFAEDAFDLDAQARAQGVTAVVDCGVAPGLCNVLAGHAAQQLDRVERYTCYVGGLPTERRWPYEYSVVFSPVDVLEEYTRPARMVEHGQPVTRPALSEVELRDFPGVGTLEAFNTDGLRSLLHTLDAPHMAEKTLRYPGHAQLMRVFRESGFLGTSPIDVKGQPIRPIDLTSKLLFEQWRLEPGQHDLTVMQVVIEGTQEGRRTTYTYDLLDRYDPSTGTTSMARTTGYTCAIVARQVARGLYTEKGVSPAEYLGRLTSCYQNLIAELARRDIHVTETIVVHEPNA